MKKGKDGSKNVKSLGSLADMTKDFAQAILMSIDESKPPNAVFRTDRLRCYVGGNYNVLGWAKVKDEFFTNSQRILLTHGVITDVKMKNSKGKTLSMITLRSEF